MTKTTLILAASLLAIGAFACAAPAIDRNGSESLPPITSNGEWRELTPRSSWSVWQPACIVRSLFDGSSPETSATATFSISTVAGSEGYIVGVSSDLWADFPDGDALSVDFGFDDEPPQESTASLPIHSGGVGPGFFIGVDADFLRRLADSATMEVYPDGAETISLDTSGAAEAIGILQACGTVELARIGVPVEELYSAERPSQGSGMENAER